MILRPVGPHPTRCCAGSKLPSGWWRRLAATLDARSLGPKLLPAAFSSATQRTGGARRKPGQRACPAAGFARFPEEMSAMVARRQFLSFRRPGRGRDAGRADDGAGDRRRPTGVSCSSSSAALPTGSISSYPMPIRPMPRCAARWLSMSARRPSSTAPSRCTRRWPKPAGCIAQKQAMFVHAVASPYRDRSHFDGQNVLETGGTQPYQLQRRLAEPAGGDAAAIARSGRGDCTAPNGADGAAREGAGDILWPVRAADGIR